jgi:flagellar motor switch/type III secretory pathway protein FliN
MLLCDFWSVFCKHSKQMATAQQMPAPASVQQNAPGANGDLETQNNQALVAMPGRTPEPGNPLVLSAPAALLAVELDVAVPVREFRVRNLLALQAGHVIESRWGNGEDVPLASGDVQLAWSEFEVIETQLAVRITRLA